MGGGGSAGGMKFASRAASGGDSAVGGGVPSQLALALLRVGWVGKVQVFCEGQGLAENEGEETRGEKSSQAPARQKRPSRLATATVRHH